MVNHGNSGGSTIMRAAIVAETKPPGVQFLNFATLGLFAKVGNSKKANGFYYYEILRISFFSKISKNEVTYARRLPAACIRLT